jgi:hypothetical protein
VSRRAPTAATAPDAERRRAGGAAEIYVALRRREHATVVGGTGSLADVYVDGPLLAPRLALLEASRRAGYEIEWDGPVIDGIDVVARRRTEITLRVRERFGEWTSHAADAVADEHVVLRRVGGGWRIAARYRTPFGKLELRGAPERAARSIVRFLSWMHEHRPDPALVDEVTTAGSIVRSDLAVRVRDLAARGLRVRGGWRVASVRDRGRRDGVVDLAVTLRHPGGALVDASGRTVAVSRPWAAELSMPLRADAGGRWRLVDLFPSDPAAWPDAANPLRIPRAAARTPVPLRAEDVAPTPEYRLPGRTIGVGEQVDGGGSEGGAGGAVAESPTLSPIGYRYVDVPDPANPLAGVCAVPGTDPADDFEAATGWVRLVQAYRRDTGADIGPPRRVCVPLADADLAEPPPSVGTVPTAGDVWRAVALPLPPVYASPPGRGVVALDTRVWTDAPAVVDVAVTLAGWTITGTARPVEHVVDFGDGAAAVGAGPGSASEPLAVHRYEVEAIHPIAVTTVWEAEVVWTGPGVPGIPLAIGRADLGSVADYPVDEVRSVLLGG